MALASVRDQLRRLRRDERGTVSIIMGLLIVPFMGFLALGFEVSNWYLITRGMQNAADASVLAAAINNTANYSTEANAVAALYGFVDGTNNVSIAVTNTATCPSGGNTCYSVTISGYTPLLVSQIVGYQGNANLNGSLQKSLSAVAVAKAATQPQDLCLLALAGSGGRVAAALLPLYYLADSTITLLRRVINREPVWLAHRSHYYQRATDRGFHVIQVVARVFVVNLTLAVLALVTILLPSRTTDIAAFSAGAATAPSTTGKK